MGRLLFGAAAVVAGAVGAAARDRRPELAGSGAWLALACGLMAAFGPQVGAW